MYSEKRSEVMPSLIPITSEDTPTSLVLEINLGPHASVFYFLNFVFDRV